MPAKKSAAKTAPIPKTPKGPDGQSTPATRAERSATGVQLVDGLPVFAMLNGQPVNRRQWIEATRPGRKTQLVNDLRAEAETLKAQQGNVEE